MHLIPVVINELTASGGACECGAMSAPELLACTAPCQLRENSNKSMLLNSSNGTIRKAVCCAKTQKQNETAGTFPARGNVPAVSFFYAAACLYLQPALIIRSF